MNAPMSQPGGAILRVCNLHKSFVAAGGRQSVFARGTFDERIVYRNAFPIVPGASIHSWTLAPGRSFAPRNKAVSFRPACFSRNGQPRPPQKTSSVAPSGARVTTSLVTRV